MFFGLCGQFLEFIFRLAFIVGFSLYGRSDCGSKVWLNLVRILQDWELARQL